jgi:dihydrofolate reductase
MNMNNRKCILYIAMSLDGRIADEQGGVGWLEDIRGDGGDSGYGDFISQIDTVLMGSVTYKQVLTFGNWPYDELDCYVLTREKQVDNGKVTFTEDSPAEILANIREEKGKQIWLMGGASLVNSFIRQGLVDEIILTLIPRVLGKGINLFDDQNPFSSWNLREVKTFGEMVQVHYAMK